MAGTGVGIDLGAHAIRVVELRISEKGAVVRRALLLDRAALLERKVDPSDRPKVAALLRREMEAAGIPARDVVLGISGKDSIIRYTHVPPVPAWRLKIIMDYEVNEVAEKIGEKLTGDFRVLPVTREDDDDQSIVIALAKEASLEGLLGDLKGAGITVAKAVPAPIALYASYSAFGKKPDPEDPEDDLTVAIDLGAETLNMAFLLNGNLAFARSASFGGKNFTEAVARDLGIDLERAELLKVRGGTLDGGAGRREETVNPLRGAAAQLLSMVGSSAKFSRSQIGARLPDPNRYVLSGGAAALPGLLNYLGSGLRKPVEPFHPAITPSPDIGGAAAKALSSSPGDFAVALGLAATGVRREGLELSLLPSKYVERRTFRERTLYLYLAASFLIIFLIVNLVQGAMDSSSARKRRDDLSGWKTFFDREKAAMTDNAAQNTRARGRINRIIQEAEVTGFQAFVLELLSKKAAPELKLTAIKLAQGATESEPTYQVQVDGAADNATGRALDAINALRVAFTSEPRVAKVEMLPIVPEGSNLYRFQMVLVPSYPAYR
jgi:type IV pilus assembly protein PilM